MTGNVYGTLKVLGFDKDKYEEDKEKFKKGELSRVRRYYVCECMKCGRRLSVRGENLVSGNTKGCGCDKFEKIAIKNHENHLNRYEYNNELDCWVGYATNTGSKFIFDKDDYELVSQYCWYENQYGYFMTRLSKTEQIFIHRLLLLGLDAKNRKELVDHKNRKPFDNRRQNLRVCNHEENARNITVKADSTSGRVGVSWYSPGNKWRSYIAHNGKFISLGYYHNLNDAIRVREEKEKELWGEFAPQ